MGENGAGKSTLCQCFNSTVPNYHQGTLKGKVEVFGINTRSARCRTVGQGGHGPGGPEAQLFTTTVRNEIAFGAGEPQRGPGHHPERIDWALGIVGLEEFIDRSPRRCRRPEAAPCHRHEPGDGALGAGAGRTHLPAGPVGTRDVYEVIRELRNKEDMTIIIATHKSEEIAEFADKVLVLKEGKLAALDTPDVIFNDEELMHSCHIRPPRCPS